MKKNNPYPTLHQAVIATCDAIEAGFPDERRETCGTLAFDRLREVAENLRFAAEAIQSLDAHAKSGVPAGWTRITVIHEDGRTKTGIVTPQCAEQALLQLDEDFDPEKP